MNIAPVAREAKLPDVTIRLLSRQRIEKWTRCGEGLTPEELFHNVVEMHNRGHENAHYQEINVPQWDAGTQGFHLRVYWRANTANTAFGKVFNQFGAGVEFPDLASASYLAFLARRVEGAALQLFVLLSGYGAHQAVDECTDYQFPITVVRRFCLSQVKDNKRAHLLGGDYSSRRQSRSKTDLSPLDFMHSIIQELLLEVNPRSSIYRLQAFQKKDGTPLSKTVSLKVTKGGIQFKRKMTLLKMLKVLEYLGNVFSGQPTTNLAGVGEENDPGFDKYQFLVPVYSEQLVRELDLAWLSSLATYHRSYGSPEAILFPEIVISHPRYDEYRSPSVFRYFLKNLTDPPLTWQNQKDAQEIYMSIRTFIPVRATPAQLLEALKTYMHFFEGPEGRSKILPLYECLSGNVSLRGDTFFKVNKTWFRSTAGHKRLLYGEFATFVNAHTLGDAARLEFPWPQSMREGLYNELYIDTPGMFIADRVEASRPELFDLMRITDGATYLYHVKAGFNQHTRDAASQICCAAERIRLDGQDVLEAFWQTAVAEREGEGYRQRAREKYLAIGERAFFEAFGGRIVFVYAFKDVNQQEVNIQRVAALHGVFGPDDFVPLKYRRRDTYSANEVYQLLINHGYLDQRGSLQEEMFRTNQEDFIRGRLSEVIEPHRISQSDLTTIYRVLTRSINRLTSTIAKLELLRTQKRLGELGYEFKIFQIPQEAG